MIRFGLITFISLFLLGCAERVEERAGITVELVPVTYTFKANVDENNQQQVSQRIGDYLELHRDKVLTEQVHFTWSSKLAKQQVLTTKTQLLTLGVDPSNVTVTESSAQGNRFNLTISLQQYQVLVPLCESAQVNRFGFNHQDCFVEGMRWQSIQHPERMIGNQANPANEEE